MADSTTTASSRVDNPRATTGIAGLDDILCGGFPRHRLYLVQGTPGVGKTTLALQFLLEGVRLGERVLYVTLSETEEEIRQVADSHGWSIDGLQLYELSSAEQTLRLDEENTLYATADIELKETVRVLLNEVERAAPARVVFDSLSEIRLLAGNPVRYRRQLLGLKQYFAGKRCTVLLLDDRSGDGDLQVESLAHGVVALEQVALQYGADRRRVRVAKLRGSRFRNGYHDYIVETGGLSVFPRLVASEHRTDLLAEAVPSGIGALDKLLGGGLDRSTATLVIGPAGCGKSALATQFACANIARGGRSALFLFEERIGTLRARSRQLGMPLEKLMQSGQVLVKQVDPAELAPDEFTSLVRAAIEKDGADLVVIDSINGYFNAMPEARFLTLQLHELLAYLSERGVTSILTMAQTGVMGPMTSPVDLSYLADTILLTRYYEAGGAVHRAIAALKKRSGNHERTIREFDLGPGGITIGEPLSDLHGVLTGVPEPAAAAR